MASYNELFQALPNSCYGPEDQNYQNSIKSYFSLQARVAPKCVVVPKSSGDVSTAVRIVNENFKKDPDGVYLAIRSGGHTAFAAAANTDKGVTIDLQSLKTVRVHEGNKVVSVGAGCRWKDVYHAIADKNLVVAGGRESDVGVGGFLTGGGLSHCSMAAGFGCDSIVSLEVVLADGSIVEANETTRPDLFRAIKGGSNNFGIVTRFDLKTYPGNDFWGGTITYGAEADLKLMDLYYAWIDPAAFNPFSVVELTYVYMQPMQTYFTTNILYNTEPKENPKAFSGFSSIQPQWKSSMRMSNIIDFSREMDEYQPSDAYVMYCCTALKRSKPGYEEVQNLWKAANETVKDAEAFVHTMTLQRVPPSTSNNCLGLGNGSTEISICLFTASWNQKEDCARIEGMLETLIQQVDAAAEAGGYGHPYRYVPYCASFQKPLLGYGEESRKSLREVSKKYDPNGFFQKAVSGFKIDP